VERGGGVSTGILASGIKLLSLPFCDRRVLEVAIETSVVGITTKSIGASEEVGSHVIDIGSVDLERGAFLFETGLMEQVDMSEKNCIPESLHILGDDVGVLGVVYHYVNQQLVDPHVLGDVGAVAVAF